MCVIAMQVLLPSPPPVMINVWLSPADTAVTWSGRMASVGACTRDTCTRKLISHHVVVVVRGTITRYRDELMLMLLLLLLLQVMTPAVATRRGHAANLHRAMSFMGWL